MTPARARYVTACQQLLALGVVVIALVPATRVVTLDVVGQRPEAQGPSIAVPDATDASADRARGPRSGRERARTSVRVAERRSAVDGRRALHRGDRAQAVVVRTRHQDERAG